MCRHRLFFISFIAFTCTVHAENWPHWRGPSASGVSPETGLPVRWSDTENIAWKVPVRGLGISSPIVWGDRIFVTSQLGSGRLATGGGVSFLVSAFDRSSGRRLWEYTLQAEGDLPSVHEKHNLASSSPVTDDRRVYAWFGNGQIVALDMEGRLVWKKHLGTEYGKFDIGWGHGSSPAIYRDTVILICYQPSVSYLLGLGEHPFKFQKEFSV